MQTQLVVLGISRRFDPESEGYRDHSRDTVQRRAVVFEWGATEAVDGNALITA
ncbi:MAG: hypothetical protein R6V61_11695 [Wenzhouxiangellaceae bacterium]